MWSEATRNPAISEMAGRSCSSELRGPLLGQAMHRWVDAGNHLSVHPDRLAPVMMSLVQGMVMQQAIDGQPPFDDYRAAVRALFESAQ